uniref:Uncharacterized protein n=1 Tax=Arundo donax TaxID=35708 RepID=A0A0A9HBY6_ARUDO
MISCSVCNCALHTMS